MDTASATEMEHEFKEWIEAFVDAVLLRVYAVISSRKVDTKKKEILLNRLSREGWKWRSIKSLCNAIREDESATRRLLIELGARANTMDEEMWTLERNEKRP